MKRRFSKILGVGLTLALLASLILTAAPVSAITQLSVTLDDYEISADAVYTITFQITEALDSSANDEIVVTFETGIDISAITDTVDGDVTIGCSSGIGVGASAAQDAGSTTDGQELTITVPSMANNTNDIGAGATVQLVIGTGAPIVNPDDTGDYTLTVATQTAVPEVIEAEETSAPFTIIKPTIDVLPGIVQQYNAAVTPILMAQATGDGAINSMVDTAGADYTIVVGPGKYEIDATIDLDQAGLTLISSGDTEDTIIKSDAVTTHLILISAADVTVDGFTIEDVPASHHGISIQGADAIVKNNIITTENPTEIGIYIHPLGPGATVSDNEIGENCTIIVNADSGMISGNAFGECLNIWPDTVLDGLTITDNTMIASAAEAIDFINSTGTYIDVLIEGNTISEAALNAIVIRGAITNLRILDNDITNNEGVGILIDGAVTTTASAIAIRCNTITGNDADNDGYGIQNEATLPATVVDATLNWWGTTVADDVAAMVNDTATNGSVTAYEPFLADTAEAVFSACDVAVGEISIAKDTAGVAVSVSVPHEDSTVNIIAVAKYIANPEEAISGAIAFYDVYVAGTFEDPETDKATIKFYAGDAQTEVYIWSADTLTWGEVTPVSYSAYGGYVYVTIEDPAMLAGTPFALVAGAAAEIDPPKILTPVTGDDTVSLTPIFAWEAVPEADGYYFEFADNANFVLPKVSLTGDLGRLIVTAYAYVIELPYSTPYYWRVKAVSGTVEAGDLGESVWASGVFITMDEPVEEAPPIVVEEAPPVVIETIQPPDIIVEIPAETLVTPGWIYVIIAVGAVLVIALVVLIVRTRRVA